MKNAINVKVTDWTSEDLRDYSEQELSLRVFNTEELYRERTKPRGNFISLLRDYFIFTEEQLEVLINDLDKDAECDKWLKNVSWVC